MTAVHKLNQTKGTIQISTMNKSNIFLPSTYPSRTETETSFKPDFGLLFNINHFNIYAGWQPSGPHHINIGVGFTL